MNETQGGPLRGLQILVVEDDPASARMVAALCSSEGAEVRIAHTATEAMATLADFPARVAIVDLILPRMSGLTLVRMIKGNPATSAIVVIAVSILNGPNIERLSLEAGCAAFVHKPIDIDHLVQTVFDNLEGTR